MTAASSPPARAPLRPLVDALAELLSYAAPLPGVEAVSTFDADGRVLAQDAVSSLNVPAHDNSAMDGYALRAADWTAADAVLPVHQRIPAGSAGSPLAAGSAARIFTGAPVPAGADTVVMQEDCLAVEAVDGGLPGVKVRVQPQPGTSIRRAGEDVASGAVVLRMGERLTPASLGLAASIGFDTLQVAPRVRVALFSTGDELVMPGDVAPADMKPGAIYNSNRFFLRALLLRLGCTVTDMGIVPDRLDATIGALKSACAQNDLILTSGGVSVGEEDHIKPAVEALGKLALWQMAIKPGKPFAYGRVEHEKQASHFIGLPGNPVSSFITFLVLVRPFILKLQGAARVAAEPLSMRADFNWPRPDKRQEFLRVRRNVSGGLDLFNNQSSGVLTSAVWGDGVIDNPAGTSIAQGDTVQFLPFSALIG
ncbi:MAG: gephyrin-like molybdotransferase Glp [Pseudomonadota bacterium]